MGDQNYIVNQQKDLADVLGPSDYPKVTWKIFTETIIVDGIFGERKIMVHFDLYLSSSSLYGCKYFNRIESTEAHVRIS